MRNRTCLDCPAIGPWARGRCPDHERDRDRRRGTRQQRGYDTAYDTLRRDYQRRMNQGAPFTCWRCGDPIDPEHWSLGHDDDDRSVIRGPECNPCNYSTSSRRIR